MHKFEIRSTIRQNDGGQEFEIRRMVVGMARTTDSKLEMA